jgi:flagellin-like hook-associated protein FlgL
LVDEYQDTNFSQYLIVKRLAELHHNICVVGDDAQSIYSFRGARIENILNFKNDYPDFKTYKLEQNYRSTQVIVDAANSLIAKNKHQLQKTVFSENAVGERIDQIKLTSDHDIKLSGSDADGVLTGLVVDTGGDGTTVTAAAAESDGLDVLDISSYAGSNLAIQQVDAALQKVNSDRASMGALQSRFQSAVTTLQTHSENLSAARSQIRDADFASETANLTRAQILQQAGVAMLSQANSAPQSVLSLLKG